MKNYLLFILSLVSFCTFIGCRSAKQAAQLVREVRTDTLYLSNVQYDSIFVFNDRLLDRSRDTVYIKDSILEYRYRLLRDTIYKTQIDSIPVIREVEVVREVRHIPWYAKLLSWIGTLALILLLARLLLFLRRR